MGNHLKEIKKTSMVAWGPSLQDSPLLAIGTAAGALDASFSTTSELEIHDLALGNDSPNTSVRASTSTSARFNRVAWGSFSGSSQEGIIAGGLEDGSLCLWNAGKLLAGQADASIISNKQQHKGPIKGLQFNQKMPHLLASGSTGAEVMLWDMNDPSKGYSPATAKSNSLDDITDLAWNCQVQHILATASNNGATVVWDLKNRREVITLTCATRKPVTAIAWCPDVPTQIVTATEDNGAPVICSWDLRNAYAPEKIFTGHEKGILAIGWCPRDSELLLSTGKDNRTICWNPKTGAIIGELPRRGNWIFDVQWCPRNPDLFATAAFDGKIEIFSYQSMSADMGQEQTTPAGQTIWDTLGQPRTERQALAHKQVPKWLRRPIGAAFGFGGRLITFSSLVDSSRGTMVTIASALAPAALVEQSVRLESALSGNMLADYCAGKIRRPIDDLNDSDSEAVLWNVLKVIFEPDARQKLLALLGAKKQALAERVKKLEIGDPSFGKLKESVSSSASSALASPREAKSASQSILTTPLTGQTASFFDQMGGAADEIDFSSFMERPVDLATKEQNGEVPLRSSAVPFRFYPTQSSEYMRLVTEALALGDFKTAVSICVGADRLSDALLVAICGGPELVAETQRVFVEKADHSYLRIVSSIALNNLSDVVENASLEDWQDILALICSYSKDHDFGTNCHVLAARLEAEIAKDSSMLLPAVICHLASGHASHAISLFIERELGQVPKSRDFLAYAKWLQQVIEKVRVFQAVAVASSADGYTSPLSQDSRLQKRLIEYAYVLANVGLMEVAVVYWNMASANLEIAKEEEHGLISRFVDRLYNAMKNHASFVTAPAAPFQTIEVVGEPVPRGETGVPPSTGQAHPQSWQHGSSPYAQKPFVSYQAAPSQAGMPSYPSPYGQTSQPTAPMQAPMPMAGISKPYGGQPSATSATPSSAANSQAAFTPPNPYAQPSMPQGAQQPNASQYSSLPQAPPKIPMPPTGFAQHPPAAMPTRPVAPLPTMTNPVGTPIGGLPAPASSAGPNEPRRPTGHWNDPPMVPPRVSPVASPAPSPFAYGQPAPARPPPELSGEMPQSGTPPIVARAVAQPAPFPAAAALPTRPTPRTTPEPVDLTKIPADQKTIQQALDGIIHQCLEKASPVQRKIFEDSNKRVQLLYAQLASQSLSPATIDLLKRLTTALTQRQFGVAKEQISPLMTNHYSEVSAWILGIRRLVETAPGIISG